VTKTPEPARSLAGQIAVVTGATGGIGRAIALALADAGAEVVVHGFRRAAAAQELADQLATSGRKAKALVGDLAVPGSRERLVEEAWAWHRGIDLWVNCAGVDVLTGEAAAWPFERKLRELWQVDVEATIHLSRAVGSRMKSRVGRS
jgi:3-oxoacyl-[acyl-carrier protein] reductase